ncbi:MAG: sodium-dependent transporter [Butyrivibrio sp.]|jgi:NSS family neurotransmitter:Na+ symporter|nr:sodium-dependent transporter [Butyrivibrio sp.]
MGETKKRASFSGKVGFVLAAASSAVGLGNIWRFPYLAAEYGGGTFLLIYLILAVTFGFSVMITEIAIGRKTGLSVVGAFKAIDKRFAFCGLLGTVIPVIITPYYSVIGGWVTKYIAVFVTGQGHAAAQDGYFSSYIAEPVQPILWFAVFIVLTAVVVALGVEKGIEKASVIMMPILILLSLVIAIYSITRPGAGAGIIYYLKPDLHKMTGKTVLAALGQLFYSMSLAMGIMITYGSYMKKTDNLESSVRQIEFFDTLVAFLAGLMIIPAVYVFSGGDESAMGAGPGLMFITLPKVFDTMTGGHFIGAAFFILVFFAALTSSISLMETIVSILMDKFKWKRRRTTVLVTIYCIAVGIPSSLGFGIWSGVKPLGMDILTFFDFISNSVLMPIMAFVTCIFAGYIMKPAAICEEVEQEGVKFRFRKFYSVMIRFVAPIGIIGILVSSVAASLGVFSW